MLNGIYQNAASMTGLEAWNNAIAQNLSQGATPGYKKATLNFEGEASGLMGYESSIGQVQHREAISASAKGGIDYTNGSIYNTKNPYDFAVEGNGFFELMMPNGQFVYTRDGQFNVNDEGELVSKQGFKVMSDTRATISLIPDGGPLVGSADGVLRQNGQRIGQLGLKSVSDHGALIRAHGGFIIDPNSRPQVEQIEGTIRHGALEASNVSVTHEMVNLINVSHSFMINQRAIRNYDELLKKSIEKLGGAL